MRGPIARRVTQAEPDSGDTLPAPKVVGRLWAESGYSARAHCSTLQSAHMAVHAIFYACGRALACPVAFGGAKEGILALDALGGQWVKRKEGEEWKWGFPE